MVLDSLNVVHRLIWNEKEDLVRENDVLDVRNHVQVILSILRDGQDSALYSRFTPAMICLAQLINACKTQYPIYHDYMLQSRQTVIPRWPSYIFHIKPKLESTLDAYFTKIDQQHDSH